MFYDGVGCRELEIGVVVSGGSTYVRGQLIAVCELWFKRKDAHGAFRPQMLLAFRSFARIAGQNMFSGG